MAGSVNLLLGIALGGAPTAIDVVAAMGIGAIAGSAPYIAAGWLLPGGKRVVPYSIQTLMRLRPAAFRQDLATLFELLQQEKIKPLIARQFPLAEARQAHELLGSGGVIGKIVLMPAGERPA